MIPFRFILSDKYLIFLFNFIFDKFFIRILWIVLKQKKLKSWAKEYHGDYLLYQPKNIDEIKSIIIIKYKIIPSGGNRSYGDSAISNNIINSKIF